jgi:uracil-DNA glycosylase family 4
MDYKSLFKDLRNKEINFERGQNSFAKNFSYDLFQAKRVSSFKLQPKISGEFVKGSFEKEEKTVLSSLVLDSELHQAVESLADFTEKVEIEKKSYSFKGGLISPAVLDGESTFIDLKAIEIEGTMPKLANQGDATSLMLISDYWKLEDAPLSEDSHFLLTKMMTAMGLNDSEFALEPLINEHLTQVSFSDFQASAELNTRSLFERILKQKPKIVLTLGALATNFFLGKRERLSKIHGQSFKRKIKYTSGEEVDIQFIPIFHPDFLLINPAMKRTTWNDLQAIMKLLS